MSIAMKTSNSAAQHPVQLLFELGEHAKGIAQGLPQVQHISNTWSGFRFRLGKSNLVAPLDHVTEILHCPKMTFVPGTQQWVVGIANVRGTLLPVMDLRGYLGLETQAKTYKSRVLVVKDEDHRVGLLVDEVLGLRHFSEEDKVTSVAHFEENIRDFVRGAFNKDGQETLVFDLKAVANHPDFFHVAV